MERLRVMVVDDAADARFLITLILGEQPDLQVVCEANGAAPALELLAEHDLDVVLVDARMPVIDGFELAAAIRDQAPAVRVAVLTSMVDEVVRARAREVGAAACFSKGDLHELPDRVRSLRTA